MRHNSEMDSFKITHQLRAVVWRPQPKEDELVSRPQKVTYSSEFVYLRTSLVSAIEPTSSVHGKPHAITDRWRKCAVRSQWMRLHGLSPIKSWQS